MKPMLEALAKLGPARLAVMALVALGTFGTLALLAMNGGADPYALLYADLDPRESGQIIDLLGRQHIAYQISGQGSQVLVPAADVARARVLLAKDGLPSGGSVGYEIFDRADGLAATEFQQAMNQTRALEGELARTIRTIDGVRAARVHLVLPKREPFARDRQDAQASVMLTMRGAARLDREGVRAVLNLIAAAVPGLHPRGISIVDSRGTLLARAGEAIGPAAGAVDAEEMRQATELRLSRAVEEMLERSLGAGHVRAQAAVEMDFDHVQETQERFDPDGQVVRSTQTTNETNKSTEASSTVSVQNNLPNADAGSGGSAGSQEGRQEETINYEIGKTVRTLMREQPQIKRISLAVMVDEVTEPGPDGKPVARPRNEQEIARIASLVRGAIGYDEKRGDHLDVVSMRFAADGDAPPEDAPRLLGIRFDRAELFRLGQTGFLGLLAVLALLTIFRPMMLRLAAAGTPALPGPMDQAADGLVPPDGIAAAGSLARPAAGSAALPVGADGTAAALAIEDDTLIDVANVQGQLRASSLRRVTNLVDRYPVETLTIMRGWMLREPA